MHGMAAPGGPADAWFAASSPTRTGAAPAAASGTDGGLGQDLKDRERQLILETLAQTAGSRKLAAERLGISPRTLRHKLQQMKAAGVALPRSNEPRLLGVS